VLLPAQANGSLIIDAAGVVIGSELIGQEFDRPEYFWGRPSATVPAPYNAAASGGSNLGPLNPALIGPEGAIQARRAALAAAAVAGGEEVSGDAGPIPVDLVTASASGLDPHISPAAALYQVDRVAGARGLPRAALTTLVMQHTEGRTLGILGEPRVSVLRLNLALDAQFQ
jgi:K+-transporting ATPase ATPase C chain